MLCDDGCGPGGESGRRKGAIAAIAAADRRHDPAHVCEVIVWALAYAIVNAAPPGADRLYFAFVNYTMLVYGDVTPVARWRLFGPAMNGVLLFGWSTAHFRSAAENGHAQSGRKIGACRAQFESFW